MNLHFSNISHKNELDGGVVTRTLANLYSTEHTNEALHIT